MTDPRPPRVATWLLSHLGSGANNDALVGDLIEQYRQGRSQAWYLRQVVTAIVVSTCKDIWSHKLLSVRALFVGWLVFTGVERRFIPTFEMLERWQQTIWNGAISGLAFFTLLMVMAFVNGAIAGWIVARLHRPHRVTMVLLFTLFMMLLSVVQSPGNWLVNTPYAVLYQDLYYVVRAVVATFFCFVGIMAGGLLTISAESRKLRSSVGTV